MLTDKPEGKGPLGGPRCRQEDNVRMDLTEMGVNIKNWIHSVQDRE